MPEDTTVPPFQWCYVNTEGRWYSINKNDDHGYYGRFSGFSEDLFGWRSDANMIAAVDGAIGRNEHLQHIVEIQWYQDKFAFAEIVSEDYNEYIYEDIATVGDALYRWELDHGSKYVTFDDSMSVMIGPPGQETAQPARRTRVSNTCNNALGSVGTIIKTHGRWAHYVGEYLCPQGQTLTRFTFKSIEQVDIDSGNNITNIVFQIAYPLRYDANGGSGSFPDPKSDNYAGYRYEGTKFNLVSTIPTRPGYTFLGWSDTRYDPVTTQDAINKAVNYTAGGSYTQPNHSSVVYAVWAPLLNITARKVWVDGETVRPQSVSVTLHGTDGSSNTMVLNAGNGWAHTWSNLPSVTSSRQVITYSLTEAAVDGFKEQVSGNQSSGFTVTNTYEVPILPDIPVHKQWTGAFASGYIPDSVNVYLVGSDGSRRTLTLTASNGWSGVFAGVPERTRRGEVIAYHLEEDTVAAFQTFITGDARAGFSVENRCTIGRGDTDKDPMYPSWQ